LCQPFGNCKQKKIHSALPSSLVMKHGAYSKTHKQKQKVQSGDAQTHLKKKKSSKCLHSCTATFM
jgi:hypothetical protein